MQLVPTPLVQVPLLVCSANLVKFAMQELLPLLMNVLLVTTVLLAPPKLLIIRSQAPLVVQATSVLHLLMKNSYVLLATFKQVLANQAVPFALLARTALLLVQPLLPLHRVLLAISALLLGSLILLPVYQAPTRNLQARVTVLPARLDFIVLRVKRLQMERPVSLAITVL